LTIGAGRTLGVREATSLGRGLINQGTLAPGLQLGSISAQSYQQTAGGTFDVQLRGTTPDTEHDRLVVTGTATLGGMLNVSLTSGFVPAPGNSFTVLTAGSLVSDFATLELPMLAAGLVWDINKTSTAYTLSIAAADFNRNGVVDAADYVVWRKTRNSSVAAYSGADANGDGIVNDADRTIWRSNFGNIRGTNPGTGGAASYRVPEPATMLSAAAAAALLAGRRRAFHANRRRAA
jgi:hypothetical protein